MGECVFMAKIIIASGYFDPVHIGHIDYLNMAKNLGDWLIVIVNNDRQTMNKKGMIFQTESDRIGIIQNLKSVDETQLSIDEDPSVCKTISFICEKYSEDEIIFAKGGDRILSNIPEAEICIEKGITIVDGLGEKIRSSSELVAKYTKGYHELV